MSPLVSGPRLHRLRRQVFICGEFQWLEIPTEQLHTGCNGIQRRNVHSLFRPVASVINSKRGFSSGGRGEAKIAKAVAVDISTTSILSEAREEKEEKAMVKDEGLRTLYKSVGILTGLQFVSNIGFGCGVPVLPLFAASLDMGPTGVGLILSISALSRLLFAIPSGRLSDAGYGR